VRAEFLGLSPASPPKLFHFRPFGRASASVRGEAAAEALPKGALSDGDLHQVTHGTLIWHNFPLKNFSCIVTLV
jgi:hypothetical protein